MAREVHDWLSELGLEKFAEVFEENEIDLDLAADLSDADLRDLGVTAMGQRKKLLRAIETLSATTTPPLNPVEPGSIPGPTASASRNEAERRQLTVMFCDLVGSTALSGRLDPEDLRVVIGAYQEACGGVISAFEGYIARYVGDGLLVYFGYPQAHEDDAERAVRAGLGVVEAVRDLDPREDVNLEVRIGIATGLVVAGDIVGKGASEEHAVLGETPNLAARLQGMAEPDTLLIADSTRRLLGSQFDFDDLGARQVVGLSEQVRVWRVTGVHVTGSRFEAGHATELTSIVGREQEIALLLDRWDIAKEGEGQIVLLSGEAGIGKSRIIQSMRDRLMREKHSCPRYQCSPHYTNTAFYPAIARLEHSAGLVSGDSAEQKLDKIEAMLGQSSDAVDELTSSYAELLSIDLAGRYPGTDLTPERQKAKFMEAMTGHIVGLAARDPVLMIFEDVHWIDPSTHELLDTLIDRVQDLKVLILISCRPEFASPWGGHAHVTTLTLNRLTRRQSADLIVGMTGNKPLPAELLDQISSKTDGVPLFVEELTKTVLESGLLLDRGDHYELDGPLPALAIPATLQDSLMARLDRLSAVKQVAQTCAAIGREFSRDLLVAISTLDESDVVLALDRLTESDLIFRRGLPPRERYIFKHALVQDAAYESLLKSARHELHARIAQVIEEQFPERAESEPEIVAHHLTEAGIVESAVGYWQRAGLRAIEASANVEAIHHFGRALEILETLPQERQRDEREFALRLNIGGPLLMVKGHGAAEAIETYTRAQELGQMLGETSQLVPVLFGLWRHANAKPDRPAALTLGKRILELAVKTDSTADRVIGHYAMGFTELCLGELKSSAEHLEKGTAQYNPTQRDSPTFQQGQDPGVACLGYGSVVAWLLGFPDTARRKSAESLTLADSLSHPFSLAYALNFAAFLDVFLKDYDAAIMHGTKAVELCEEQGFSLFLNSGRMSRGWACACAEHRIDGLTELEDGITGWSAIGTEIFQPFYFAMLAEAHLACGRVDQAGRALDDATTLALDGPEPWWDAEILRLRGELMCVENGDEKGAEDCFRRAIETAEKKEAKSLELRAATSLAGLLRDRGEIDEARSTLAPIYEWFSEGFNAPDLVTAHDLLEEIS